MESLYILSNYDPVTPYQLEMINKLKKNYKLILLVSSESLLECMYNKIVILKKFFDGKIEVFNKNIKYQNINIFEFEQDIFNKFSFEYKVLDSEDEIAESNIEFLKKCNVESYSSVEKDFINSNYYYLKTKLSFLMSEKRLLHSFNVGKMAVELALASGYKNIKTALLSGVLHDIAKQFKKEENLLFLKNTDYEFVLKEHKNIHHGFVGAEFLKKVWKINDKEILESVRYHTVGREEMTSLDKIVFCADKVSQERRYKGVNKFRSRCFKNLDMGFIRLLENQYIVVLNKLGDNSIGKMLKTTYKYYFN